MSIVNGSEYQQILKLKVSKCIERVPLLCPQFWVFRQKTEIKV